MKTILLVILGLVVCSYAFDAENMDKCQATLAQFISGSMSQEGDSISIPQVLKACDLSQATEKFTVSSECIADLSKASDILKQISTQDNKAKLALEITMLKSLYTRKIQKSCHFLNVVNIQPSNSSGVCLQAAYQLSLDVQTMWQHISQVNFPVAFADFQKLLDDVPNTLDTCGDHALADKIRKEFPAACLRAFDKLTKELSKIQHNFDHLQWLVKNWKDITGTFNNVRKSCPIFA